MVCLTEGKPLSPDCFETIFHTMAEAAVLIDTDGVIRYCNRSLEQLSGFAASRIIGKKCGDIMSCACFSMSDCELFKRGEVNSIECRLTRASGQPLPVLKNGRVLRNQEGVAIGAVETLTDISALRQTQQRLAVLEEAEKTRQAGRTIIGHSHRIREVLELIELAAASNATVLLSGETGTGKELAARAIHEAGPRASGPFVKVNCSALPETLLESELFGHARGSFTGAVRDKPGRFESADGGTLFLDEIGEVSPLIQVKLLRFLQEREFERVGENTTRKADVRIIAATNRDLRALTRSGDFREDLYYRLKVFPIHLPPLRERKEDVGLLVAHFVEKFNRETGKALTGLSHDAAVTLMDYCWPGNIRELENAIEHAFVTCKEGEIGIFDLPLEIRRVELRSGNCATPDSPALPADARASTSRTITRETLVSALERHAGNRSEVARALGVDRTTVWRAMRRFGLVAGLNQGPPDGARPARPFLNGTIPSLRVPA